MPATPAPRQPARRAVLGAAVGTALAAALGPGLAACSRRDDGPALRTVTLPPDAGAVLANPDRGLTVPQELHYRSAGDKGLWPLADTDWSAARSRGDTLVFRLLYAERHLDGSPLAPELLDTVRADLEAARSAGMRVVPRLAYAVGHDPVRRGVYHDSPPLPALLRHVEQLGAVLDEHADAVLAVEHGSYGLWGEMCYTDRFATGQDERNVSGANWEDRFRVLDEWLTVTAHSGLPVLVRLPALLDRYAAARSDSPHLPRVGIHDDAVDASEDDLGTYSLLAVRGVAESRRAVRDVGERTPFGGECSGGRAQAQEAEEVAAMLRDRRITFLGSGLPSRWDPADVRRRLGYRLVAPAVRLGEAPAPGGTCVVEVDVRNDGSAPPVTPRTAVVEVSQGRTRVPVRCTGEVRGLLPGDTVTLRAEVRLPASATGEWAVSLRLPDPRPRVETDPRFAIRLANTPWDPRTGGNGLTSLTARTP